MSSIHAPQPVAHGFLVGAAAARRTPGAAKQIFRRSPATFIMLAILITTSLVVRLLVPELAHGITRHVSSNLHHLQHLRFGTLIGSAFWLDDGDELLPWTLLFLVIQAPAEAWQDGAEEVCHEVLRPRLTQ